MKHALQGIIGERSRNIIHAVVDEIMAPPADDYAFQLMPIKQVPASILIHERISAFGGLTGERAIGEPGKAINAGSRETRAFFPGSYQEHVRFDERDLLMLRKIGTIGDRGITGLTSGELDDLSRAGQKLRGRMSNRMRKLIYDSIFNGNYQYKSQNFDFAIPSGNAITALTDWSVPSTGKPFTDLFLLQSTNAKFLKYKIKEFVINPKTAADIMNTQETRDILKNYNLTNNDINNVGKFLFPGLAPIRVVAEVWQDETLAADGTVVLGNSTFFVPDDKVLVVPDFGGTMYGAFGEFDITENMNDPSATLDSPAVGVYTFVDEDGLQRREAPYVKVVGGFNGGPNLLRSNDTFVISV